VIIPSPQSVWRQGWVHGVFQVRGQSPTVFIRASWDIGEIRVRLRLRGALWRCAAPWMALLKPYKDVFTGVLQKTPCNLSTRFPGFPAVTAAPVAARQYQCCRLQSGIRHLKTVRDWIPRAAQLSESLYSTS